MNNFLNLHLKELSMHFDYPEIELSCFLKKDNTDAAIGVPAKAILQGFIPENQIIGVRERPLDSCLGACLAFLTSFFLSRSRFRAER